MTDKETVEFYEKSEKVVLICCGLAGMFIAGYLVGRFTCISDYEKGILKVGMFAKH